MGLWVNQNKHDKADMNDLCRKSQKIVLSTVCCADRHQHSSLFDCVNTSSQWESEEAFIFMTSCTLIIIWPNQDDDFSSDSFRFQLYRNTKIIFSQIAPCPSNNTSFVITLDLDYFFAGGPMVNAGLMEVSALSSFSCAGRQCLAN